MNIIANTALLESYEFFINTAQPYMTIKNEAQYISTLNEVENALDALKDIVNAPLGPLINMLSKAIEEYESESSELISFIQQASDIPADIAMIKTLKHNHKLTGSDLPEIGDKTLVSKVMNGKRALTRSAIEKLSVRLNLHPSMFFDE